MKGLSIKYIFKCTRNAYYEHVGDMPHCSNHAQHNEFETIEKELHDKSYYNGAM